MTSNASCPGPCQRRCCGLGSIAFVVSVFGCVAALCCVYALAMQPEADRYDDARLKAAVAAADADIHAAHRRVSDEAKARTAEADRIRHDIRSEADHRKADVARLDNRITDTLTRDLTDQGNLVLDLIKDLKAEEKHRKLATVGLGENIVDDRRRIKEMERVVGWLTVRLAELEKRPGCKCQPAPVAPQPPPAPTKVLPQPVPPQPIWYITPGPCPPRFTPR